MSKTKKEIDLLEKDLNKLSKKEKKLLKELRSLEKREKALKSDVANEKIRLSQLVKQTYILGYSADTRSTQRVQIDSEISRVYLKRIALQRSVAIKNFNAKIKEIDLLQEKNRRQEETSESKKRYEQAKKCSRAKKTKKLF